jgi:hypothetical protein
MKTAIIMNADDLSETWGDEYLISVKSTNLDKAPIRFVRRVNQKKTESAPSQSDADPPPCTH